MTQENERDEQRHNAAQSRSDTGEITREERARAPRTRTEMRDRYDQFG
jgi:hypothetical protein